MNPRESRPPAGAACIWLVVLATACSSSSAKPSDAGAPDGVSGDAAADAGVADAAPESGGDSGVATAGSSIVILQLVGSMASIGDILATFDPHYAAGLGCTRTVSGGCTVDDCTAVDMQGAMLLGEGAGTLTVSGARLPTAIMLHPSAAGTYRQLLGGNPLFGTGDVFQVSAPGDVFPAVTGQSAAAPAPVTITSPAMTTGTAGPTYTYDPTAALTWTWTGGQAGATVIISVLTSGPDLTVTCTFDATAGTGTIPQDVVAELPAKPSTLQIVAASSTMLAAGSQSVLLELETGGEQASFVPQ